jgi:hypothetical protein
MSNTEQPAEEWLVREYFSTHFDGVFEIESRGEVSNVPRELNTGHGAFRGGNSLRIVGIEAACDLSVNQMSGLPLETNSLHRALLQNAKTMKRILRTSLEQSW